MGTDAEGCFLASCIIGCQRLKVCSMVVGSVWTIGIVSLVSFIAEVYCPSILSGSSLQQVFDTGTVLVSLAPWDRTGRTRCLQEAALRAERSQGLGCLCLDTRRESECNSECQKQHEHHSVIAFPSIFMFAFILPFPASRRLGMSKVPYSAQKAEDL